MKLIDTNIMFKYLRFSELVEKFSKGELVFEDFGYVDDIDGFLTGCLSNLPNSFNFNLGRSYVLIGELGCKRFKTILDFMDGRIKCQGLYYNEMEGYLRCRILDMIIGCNMVLTSDDRVEVIEYFRNNFL